MKRLVSLVLVFLMIAPFQTASAAKVTTKAGAKLAVTNIQKSIMKSTSELRDLGENSIVGNSKIAQKYRQLLSPITNKYVSDRSTAEQRVTSTLADLNRKSNFVIQWSNFAACNGNCIVGTVVNFPFNTTDEIVQSGFDRNVAIGVITPQDKVAYDKARSAYKTALQDLVKVDDAYQEADYSLRTRIFEEYDAEEERLKSNLAVQKLALVAAKRASLALRDFETNYKIAFQFQYNLDSLYLVGSASFSQIESYLDALNVVSASQAYSLGAGISRKYQASKASSFNKALGNVFTKDPEFKSLYSQALSLYRGNSPTTPKVPVSQAKASIVSTPNFTLSFADQVLTAAVLIPPDVKNSSENIIGIKGRLFQGDTSLLSSETVQELKGNENVVNLIYDLSGLWTVLKSRNLPLRFQVEYYGSSGSGRSVLKEITLP
jgi:hypothetical protein